MIWLNPTTLTLASLSALIAWAPAQETLTQAGVVTGTVKINFNTRTNVTNKNKPKPGFKDVYEIDLNVAKTTQFRGKVERQPLITSDLLGRVEQPGQLQYGIDLFVINPADMTQKRQVGKWLGVVPIDAAGVYGLGGTDVAKHRFAVDATGRAPGFTDAFGGNLIGKGKKPAGALAYVRKLQGKDVTVQVKKADPMTFSNVTLAMGPAQIYPSTKVSGNLDFDYDTGNWMTNGIKMSYTLNGKSIEDTITGSIKWVEDEDRATNGKGRYEFNLRFNEATSKSASTEGDSFAQLSDEEAFFAVDKSVPTLTGTVEYVDKLMSGADAAPSESRITYNLEANQLTKQQIMNFVKLWMLGIGPTNDE